MKKKTEKSAEQRARELFKKVYPEWELEIFKESYFRKGWLKLARYVLSLEKKKKGRRG